MNLGNNNNSRINQMSAFLSIISNFLSKYARGHAFAQGGIHPSMKPLRAHCGDGPIWCFPAKWGVPYPEPQIKLPSPPHANNDAVPGYWLSERAARNLQLVVGGEIKWHVQSRARTCSELEERCALKWSDPPTAGAHNNTLNTALFLQGFNAQLKRPTCGTLQDIFKYPRWGGGNTTPAHLKRDKLFTHLSKKNIYLHKYHFLIHTVKRETNKQIRYCGNYLTVSLSTLNYLPLRGNLGKNSMHHFRHSFHPNEQALKDIFCYCKEQQQGGGGVIIVGRQLSIQLSVSTQARATWILP